MRRSRYAVAFATIALFPSTVSATQAGTYTVYTCNAPSGKAVGTSGWSRATESTDPLMQVTMACAAGGPTVWGTTAGAHARGAEVGLQWVATQNTTIVGARLVHDVFVPGSGTNWGWQFLVDGIAAGSNERLGLETCVNTSTACSNDLSLEGQQPRFNGGRKLSQLLVMARCSTQFPMSCPSYPVPHIAVESAVLTVEDVLAPQLVEAPHGSLLNPTGPLSGLAHLTISAADKGGGLQHAEIVVDGSTAARTSFDEGRGTCLAPFSQPTPCPLQAHRVLGLDTSKLANGRHTVSLRLVDVAGNVTTHGAWSIETRNNGSGSASRDPALSPRCPTGTKQAVRMTLDRDVVRRSDEVDVVVHVAKSLRSRVSDVMVRSRGGEAVWPLRQRTERGPFTARVRFSKSVRLRAIARGDAPVQALACSRELGVKVRASTSISPSRRFLSNGDSLELSGGIRSAPVPSKGLVVRIRVRAAGSQRWLDAGETRSDATGSWTWRHRFTRTLRPTTFIFRAVIPRQKRYPFARGMSRSVRVHVRG